MKSLSPAIIASACISLGSITLSGEETAEITRPPKTSTDKTDAITEEGIQKSLTDLNKQLLSILQESEEDSTNHARGRTATAFSQAIQAGTFKDATSAEMLKLTLNSLSSQFPELSAATANIQSQLASQLNAKQAAQAELLENTYQELTNALLSAEKPEELDEWIKRLADLSANRSKYYGSSSSTNNDLQRLQSYLQSASQLTVAWQDYLMHCSLKNIEEARRSASSLVNQTARFPYTPRSKALLLKSKLDRPNPFSDDLPESKNSTSFGKAYVDRLTSTQSALDVYSELLNMGSTQRNKLKVEPLYNNLRKFHDGYNYIMRGSYSSGAPKLRDLQGMKKLDGLSHKLLISGYRRSASVPDSFQSKESERVEAFIDRYLKTLSDNPKELWLALEASADFTTSNIDRSLNRKEIKALEYLTAAQSYEKQKQFDRAMVAYRQFLASMTRYTTKESIHEKVQELRKTHPEAAENADAMSTHTSYASYRTRRQDSIHPQTRELIRQEVRTALREINSEKSTKQPVPTDDSPEKPASSSDE